MNESFCIIRNSFLMSIFADYWQKWFVDVILYSPWSTDLFETYPFTFYFYVTLWTANNASLFRFNFYRQWLSQCSIWLCLWTANVTFCSVVETPAFPKVVFNSSMLHNFIDSLVVRAFLEDNTVFQLWMFGV